MPSHPAPGRLAAALALLALPLACASSPAPESPARSPACTSDLECPGPSSACLSTRCLDGRCAASPSPAGPVPDIQVEGDCKQAACDGQGHLVSRADSDDLPADDGMICTDEICTGDVPEHRPLASGTPCGGGGVCGAGGACITCVAGSRRCGTGRIDLCSDKGQWASEAPCSGACTDGACRPFVELSLGSSHSCGRFVDGSVACWGNNSHGQLGHTHREEGTVKQARGKDDALPQSVPGISDAQDIAVGSEHACALRKDGSVLCWGSNDFGQLGDGTNKERERPVAPVGLKDRVKQIAAGEFHTCALLDDGSARCWGENDDGQLGDGSVDRPAGASNVAMLGMANPEGPRLVRALGAVSTIRSRDDITCALLRSGSVACWGTPVGYGQLIDKASKKGKRRAVAVRGLHDATALALGGAHSCALLRDKTAVCWGDNAVGQLGDGTTQSRTAPAPVSGLAGIEELSAARHSTCARLGDGSVHCWGSNGSGQLGDGSKQTRSAPVLIAGLREARALTLSADRSCATQANGAILCWGDTRFGEIHAAMETPLLTPTPFSIDAIVP